MIRARLDKEQESKQQRVATIFTAAATALSVLVLIDKDAARAFEQMGVASSDWNPTCPWSR